MLVTPVGRLASVTQQGNLERLVVVVVVVAQCSVVSDSLRPHGLQPTRLLCLPLSPGICSDSCPLSLRCYLTISSSAAPFSFCLFKLYPSIDLEKLTFLTEYHTRFPGCFGYVSVPVHNLRHSQLVQCFML